MNHVSSIAIKIIAEIIVGPNSRSERESERFHHHVKHVKQLLNYRTIHRPENSLISAVWWLNPKRQEYNKHIAAAHEIINEDIARCVREVEESQKLGNNSDKPFRSLIEEMLIKGASLDEIQNEVDTFFIVVYNLFTFKLCNRVYDGMVYDKLGFA